MTQLQSLKLIVGSMNLSDDTLNFYLDNASSIICTIRNSNVVESKYLTTQIKIAVEMINKIGAEGQVQHAENGITRTYESSDISRSLLGEIIPMVTTPFSITRVV